VELAIRAMHREQKHLAEIWNIHLLLPQLEIRRMTEGAHLSFELFRFSHNNSICEKNLKSF
jgi:hypothetical protein